MKRLSAPITILAAGGMLASSARAQTYGTVRSVVDGDTVWAQIGGRLQKIRLSHIDAPEFNQAGGELAQAQLQELLPPGSQISVTPLTTTSDGIMIAEVINYQGVLTNLKMVQDGGAVAYDPFLYGSDPALYLNAQAEAELQQVGIHGITDFVTPSQFRLQQAEMSLTGSPGWVAFAPPIQLSPKELLGVGGLGVLSMVILAKVLWRSPNPATTGPSVRQLRSQLKTTKRALQETLASQKLLERQHHQAQLKVEDWLRRADLAQKGNDAGLMEQALVHKGTHAQQAEALKQSLQEATHQVSVLRQTLVELETQISSAQSRKG